MRFNARYARCRGIAFLFWFSVYPIFLHAQLPVLAWARSMGGSSQEQGRDVMADSQGNVISVGEFNGTADFDPGPSSLNLVSPNSYDAYVHKLDAGGNLVWALSYGNTTFHDFAYAMTTDAVGNIYIAGIFTDVVDFDPGPGTFTLTSYGDYDAYILKLDPNGVFQWVLQAGGSLRDECYAIDMDASGFIYITGTFQSTADFDPGPGYFPLTASGPNDIFIAKFDFNGTFYWARPAGGGSVDIGMCIDVDDAGSFVYCGGSFMGTADFDPSPSVFNLVSSGSRDAFVWKLDGNGNMVWAAGFGSPDDEELKGIFQDASGNVHSAGFFRNTVDFDPGPGTANVTSAGSDDIFIHNMDASGNFQWVKTIGSTNYDKALSLGRDATGNIFCTGYYKGTVDFDPGPGTYILSSSSENVFLLKLNPSGVFTWAFDIGNTGADFCNAVHVSFAGDIYITGFYELTSDFDPSPGVFNLGVIGGQDIFVAKYYDGIWSAGNESIPPLLEVFPNPADDHLNLVMYSAHGQMKAELLNTIGKNVWSAEWEVQNGKNAFDIELDALPAGVYFLKVRAEGLAAVKKIIKR